MRLPTDVRTRFIALGLTALLASCGRFGGDGETNIISTVQAAPDFVAAGPEADYPVVVGEPYSINGTLYTPVDTMNYDEVGYASVDGTGGRGITVAHRTLPMPSYVEITALDTGKTILARVERRGPMTGNGVVGLSSGAQAQLEIAANAPIRIRRVNPIEADRAKLRIGDTPALRMETPASLLAVLKRKLSSAGSVSLASQQAAPPQGIQTGTSAQLPALAQAGAAIPKPPVVSAPVAPVRTAAAQVPIRPANRENASFEQAFTSERKVVTSYPLAPLSGSPRTASLAPKSQPAATPRRVSVAAATPIVSVPKPATQAPEAGNFVIQAAAFSSKANADRLASSIDGFVQKSGSIYRVRKGPFVSRGQAEAALAKVRAAGYKDARVFTAG